MKSYFSLVIAIVAINTDLFAAEAGMPQLDPTYWASQVFWLILVFTILYVSISKFYLPKIKDNFDLSPRGIREMLDLNKPIYEKTAAYGHFGRIPDDEGSFSWEKTDKSNVFSK